MSEEKKNVTVHIQHLKEAFPGTDLSKFEPGATYPMSELMDALQHRPRHERHDVKPRGDIKYVR